jgi:hypothetical protein
LLTDIDAIATYLPSCDAMMIDNECADRVAEARAELNLDYGAVFSMRSRDEFLTWLRELAAPVPGEHRQLVESVYGPTWLDPYRELFGQTD